MNSIHKIRYDNFISSRKLRTIPKNTYTENHHIIPRALGGSDESENIIILTAREHFIAHMILWKSYGGKMTNAFWYMTHNGHHRNILNSKQYQLLKENFSVYMSNIKTGRKHSIETKEKMSKAHKGKKYSIESRKKMSESGKKSKTDDSRRKVSEVHKGKIVSKETRKKMSDSHKGKKFSRKCGKMSEEHKKKISASVKKTLQNKKLKKEKTTTNII